jgi:hypothetical protein
MSDRYTVMSQTDGSGSLWISSSVKVIRKQWKSNPSITAVRFAPDSRLRAIPAGAFANCSNLVSVSIPASVEIIEAQAIEHCTALKEILFAPDGRLRKIDGFQGNTNLSRVEIPPSVEWIGSLAFLKCYWLSEVTFTGESRMKRIDGFQWCCHVSRVAIPRSVEEIGLTAFHHST